MGMVPAVEAADQEGIGDTDLTEQIVVSVIVKCCFSSPLGEETVEMGKRNTCLRMLSGMGTLSGACGTYLFVHVVIFDMEMLWCYFFVIVKHWC